MKTQSKIITKIIAPILLGAVFSILVRFGLFRFLSLIVSDKWEPSDFFIILLAFILPVLLGCFLTAFFFAETKLVHAVITSILFAIVIIFPEITHFSIKVSNSKDIYAVWLEVLTIIVVAGFVGGYIGMKLKQNRKIN
jgi:hypothetical protein